MPMIPSEYDAAWEAEAREAELRAQAELARKTAVCALATSLMKEFDELRLGRQDCENRWLDALRMYRGVYSEDEEKRIGANRSRVFISLVKQKIDSSKARLMSLLFPASGENNWNITPTPMPDLDPEYVRLAQMAAQREGRQPPSIQEMAQRAADAMSRRIADQLVESNGRPNYRLAASRAIFQGLLYGTGIIKGPLVELRKARRLGFDDSSGAWGMFEVEGESELCPYFEHVSVWNVYLDQTTADPERMRHVWQTHLMSARELTEWLAAEPLFDTGAILSYVAENPHGDAKPWHWETEFRAINLNNDSKAARLEGRYRVYERWGQMSGLQLREAGIDIGERANDARVFDTSVWLLGGRIIKIAPVPIAGLGIPYYMFFYGKDESNIYGDGMAWVLRDVQASVNAAVRAIQDNAAASAGPQIALNFSALPSGTDLSITPFKIWPFESAEDMQRAMQVWNIPTNSDQLLKIYILMNQIADEISVPRYLSGDNSTVRGAGDTATGLGMLMNAANLTVQDLVRNFDDGVTKPFISGMYSWNMVLSNDPLIKGDFDVVATGSSGLIAKEAEGQKMLQAVQLTNNPRFLGRIKDDQLLEEIFKRFDLSPSLLRTESEFMEFQRQKMLEQAGAQAQANVQALVGEMEKRGGDPAAIQNALMGLAAQSAREGMAAHQQLAAGMQ